MPQLRQLVIATGEPSRLAEFYQNVFEFDKIEETHGAVLLPDAVFSLALLTEPPVRAAGLETAGLRDRQG